MSRWIKVRKKTRKKIPEEEEEEKKERKEKEEEEEEEKRKELAWLVARARARAQTTVRRSFTVRTTTYKYVVRGVLLVIMVSNVTKSKRKICNLAPVKERR